MKFLPYATVSQRNQTALSELFGQQTLRRRGWGTLLEKRAAA